jgi:hypothetical protein
MAAERRARLAVLVAAALVGGCGSAASALPPPRHNSQRGGDGSAAVVAQARPISLGTFDDALSPGDPRDEQGHHERAYEIDLDPAQRVRMRVPSGELDPVLVVEGPEGSGFRIENDDAAPGTLDAMLDFVPPVAGRYRVIVTTAPPLQTGRFRLSILARDPGGIGARIELGGRASGVLGGQVIDPDLGPGVALMYFEAQGGSIVRVRVTSRAFDTIATVLGPNGQTWTNDDANDLGPDGTERALDSTVVIAAPVTGVYQLAISAYGAGGGGGPFAVATTLRPPVVVRAGDAAPAGAFAGPDGGGRILGLYAGITEYVDQGRLYGCADDARLLGEAMRASRLQRVDEQIVLTDAAATRQALLDGIRSIAQRARAEDVVIVFWSGHGNVEPAANDPR